MRMVLAMLLLAGCSTDPAPGSQTAYAWVDAPEGSKFGRAQWTVANSTKKYVARCWPRNGKFGCVFVTPSHGQSGSFDVHRSELEGLPDYPSFALVWSGSGYSCGYSPLMGWTEMMARSASTALRTNSSMEGSPWSAEEVNKYLADNKVEGSRHFDCRSIQKAVSGGGEETLGTTSITRRMAGF